MRFLKLIQAAFVFLLSTILGTILTILFFPLILFFRSIVTFVIKNKDEIRSILFAISIVILLFLTSQYILKEKIKNKNATSILSYYITGILFYLIISVCQKFFISKKSNLFGHKPKAGVRVLKNWNKIKKLLMPVKFLSNFFLLLYICCAFLIAFKFSKLNEDLLYIPIVISMIFFSIYNFINALPKMYENQILDINSLEKETYVLYLRSFKNAYSTFYEGKFLEEFGKDVYEYDHNNSTISFENFISAQCKIIIGEVLGLGDPLETYPHESVKLAYFFNNWKQNICKLIADSKCIFMLPDISQGIKYELEQIVGLGCQQKLYLFTKPQKKMHPVNIVLDRIFLIPFKLMGVSHSNHWNNFEKLLIESGFKSSIFPKNGAVVGFNTANEAIILKTNCYLPSEYVFVVKEDLAKKNNCQSE